jgi:outer membrane protein insertion porin family
MPSVPTHISRALLRPLLAALCLALLSNFALAQPGGMGGRGMGGASPTPRPQAAVAAPRRPHFGPTGPVVPIKEINIIGHRKVKESKIRSFIQSRVDRPFDPELLQQDVRRLTQSGLFQDVRTYTRDMDGGLSITIEVFERPTIAYIKVVGNDIYSDEYLAQKSGLKVGEALNIYSVDTAAGRVQDHYHSKGYRHALVSVLEGNAVGHEGVVFGVHEGEKERIWDVEFIGNEVATDGRLKTQIQSKPAIFKYGVFRGAANPKLIDEDVEKLTAYYRQLGYFHARVGREVETSESGAWTNVTFVIDEGPRYSVGTVRFVGNEKFGDEELAKDLQLKDGEPYLMAKMNDDLRVLRDIYGSQGFIFADIQADPRFYEEPGRLDLVYNISEGEQYRVGEITVHIDGENPHTRRSVVLNRLSFAPGDIIDSRQIRDSERRLKYSQLFRNDPQRGISPKIVVRPPEEDSRDVIAKTPTGPRRSAAGSEYRGQSPDDAPHTARRLDVDIYVDALPVRLPPIENEQRLEESQTVPEYRLVLPHPAERQTSP